MFKFCKWLYKLGYDRGWDNAKRDEEDKRHQRYELEKALEKMTAPK